jgi:superfamily II DNA or RNA helicase
MYHVDLHVKNLIVIDKRQLPPHALFGIKNRFTAENPQYHIMKNAGLKNAVPNSHIQYYYETADRIAIPRGTGTWIRNYLSQLGCTVNVIDNRVLYERIDIDLNFGVVCANGKTFDGMHSYQEGGIRFMVASQQAIFNAGCGGGKTVTGMGFICAVQQPTLIVVHTGDLAAQWQRELAEKTKGAYTLGMVGLGQESPGDVTIATVQKLARYSPAAKEELMGRFGAILMDECFPSGARVWAPSSFGGDWITMKELYEGDRENVMAFNFEAQRVESKRIVRKIRNEVTGKGRKWRTIKMDKGGKTKLTGTHKHKVFLLEKGWTPLGEVEPGDFVAWYRSPQAMRVIGVRDTPIPDGLKVYRYNLEVADHHNYYCDGALVSNCHHAPADTFADVLNWSPAYYRQGLTATPKRSDSMEFLMFDTISTRVFEVKDEEMVDSGVRTAPPIVTPIPTGYQDGRNMGMNMRQKQLSDLSKNANRNARLVAQIKADWEAGYFALAISQRTEHCRQLKLWLEAEGMTCGLLIGDVAKELRAEVIRRGKAGELDIIIGTKVADEGLDIPQLDLLHLAMPHGNEHKLKQQAGRIQRDADGCNHPLIRDYVDGGNFLANMYTKRLRAYRKWGFDIRTT